MLTGCQLSLLLGLRSGSGLKQARWFPLNDSFFLEREKKAEKSKKKSGETDSRSIRLVSCVLGDADLQFFCRWNNRDTNREGDRDIERKNTFPGSGAETNTEAQGVNIVHLQWDFAAMVDIFFWKKLGL